MFYGAKNVMELKADFMSKGINAFQLEIKSVNPLFSILILPLLRNITNVKNQEFSPRITLYEISGTISIVPKWCPNLQNYFIRGYIEIYNYMRKTFILSLFYGVL